MSRSSDERRYGRNRDSADDRANRRARGERSAYRRRYTRRYREDETDPAAAPGGDPDRDTGGRMPERAHGGRRSPPESRRQGNPRTGSQRGEESVQNPSGRVGHQFGDLHAPRPSESRAAGFHAEEQFGGEAGRSARDRRYGSRRGHGSQRREDPRTRPRPVDERDD